MRLLAAAKQQPTEASMQKACAAFLDELQILRRLLWCHVPNEAMTKASVKWHVKRKKLGVKAGFPDIVILGKDKKMLFIELKHDPNMHKDISGTRLLTEAQRKWEIELNEFGYTYKVICEKNEVGAVRALEKLLKEVDIL
jgi:hypothetical protein